MHMLSSPRLGRIGLGVNVVSIGILSAEYLLFGHVRLLALTVCLWLILFYGLYRLQPARVRTLAPGVMEVLSGFGLVFQVLSFLTISLDLSGWAAMAPELVFLAVLCVWLVGMLARTPRAGFADTGDGGTPVQAGKAPATQPSERIPELLADPLGAGLSEGRTARLRPTHTHAVRNAAE